MPRVLPTAWESLSIQREPPVHVKKEKMIENILKRRSGMHWILLSLPMIGVWLFFLLVFFPGFVTDDAFYEIRQFISGQYNDWHPILYAILIGVITRIYFSPVAVVVFQILIVSISFAWGLGELSSMGVSRRILWTLAVVSSIAPFNIVLTLTLWKDVPYSVCLFILSVIFLKIINTKGEWLISPWHLIGLGVVLSGIGLFRTNGLPVAVGSSLILIVFFHKRWKKTIIAVGIFAGTLAIFLGPVYSLLNVKRVSEFNTVIFLHHIAAHIQAGTPLNPEEADYIDQLTPRGNWLYDCCAVMPTMVRIFPDYSFQKLDLPLLKQDILMPARVSLGLFLRNPGVDFHHMACTSQIVWNVDPGCPDLITEGLLPLQSVDDPIKSYRISGNEFGFVPASLLPTLIRYGNSYLQVNSRGIIHELLYSPALFLLVAIINACIYAFREKSWRVLLFLTPMLIQSFTLILINLSQSVRFQFAAYLVGILSIGLLFIPSKKKSLDAG